MNIQFLLLRTPKAKLLSPTKNSKFLNASILFGLFFLFKPKLLSPKVAVELTPATHTVAHYSSIYIHNIYRLINVFYTHSRHVSQIWLWWSPIVLLPFLYSLQGLDLNHMFWFTIWVKIISTGAIISLQWWMMVVFVVHLIIYMRTDHNFCLYFLSQLLHTFVFCLFGSSAFAFVFFCCFRCGDWGNKGTKEWNV